MPGAAPAIRVRAVRKAYGPVRAVDGIDCDVSPGEIFALLGPNGAGKTTLVEMLEGYRRRDAGSIEILGHDPEKRERALRQRIGIVLQQNTLEPQLTVREILDLYRPLYPRGQDPAHVASLLGLGEKVDARVSTLSGGQKRRVDLALALIGDPDVLFLDEPTVGFDPEVRAVTQRLLLECKARGKTIVLTSHDLEEVEHLADRVAVLVSGRMILSNAIPELRRKSATEITFRLPGNLSPEAMPASLPGATVHAGKVAIRTDAPTALLADLTGWAASLGAELIDLQVHRPSLRDLYLELIAEHAAEGAVDG